MLIQIEHLTITHTKDLRTLLEDFSLVLNEGDIAVIVGEEGNGKSTLLKLIYDESLVAPYAEWSGSILRGNTRFGYLPQELPGECADLTVAEYMAASPEYRALHGGERAELERSLGLRDGFLGQSCAVGRLSGGEKVKLQLSRIMAAAPDVLLLDEPSNDLDIATLEWLEEYIPGCGVPVLFVSHDETLIERTANTVIHLELLRRKTLPRAAVARLSYGDYVRARRLGMERQARISGKEQAEFDAKMERFRRIREKVERQQGSVSRQDPHGGAMLKKKMHTVQAMGRRFEKEKERVTAMPETEEAIFLTFPERCALPAGKTVLDFTLGELRAGERLLAANIALRVTGGERVCIIGANGAGKTTLLRAIAAELLPRRDIRGAYMPQNYGDALPGDVSPVEYLNESGGKEEATRIRSYLGSLRYTSVEMEHPIRELSGGQRAKLLMVRMALGECNVLLLDEPTRNFSPLSAPVVRDALRAFPGTIISVSHDRRFLSEVSQTVYELTADGLQRIW
jgi:ATPase subunit of ABC transporter with duplicated ATPase domains